jgi:2-C-methyl-D-erythritol 4-phosphate cytidylyltransferase
MVSAIILAAGKGIRMKGSMRKQYLDLSGQPVLAHSIMAVDSCSLIEEIILVVPKEDVEYCQNKILSLLDLKNQINLIHGGDRRQDSVYNGLQAVTQPTETIVIHDGARPFIHSEELKECILASKKFGACILATPASDTLKRVYKSGLIETTISRENIWLAQTPQVFQFDLILKAHETARRDGYTGTDDASLVERLGEDVKIINGGRYNIKITKNEDLAIAKAIFDARLV